MRHDNGATWNSVPGVFSIEVMNIDDYAHDIDGNSLPMLGGFVSSEEYPELVIEFVSSGHYEPASMYGGADRTGWPESGAEDRELTVAYLLDGKNRLELPRDVQEKLFKHYREQVYSADLKEGA